MRGLEKTRRTPGDRIAGQRPIRPTETRSEIYDIFEGTEQIQQLVIARAVSGLRIEHLTCCLIERAEHAVGAARADIARLDHAAAARTAWDHAHGWRPNRIDEIDDTLAHHWAEVVLRAARADDPVAFGADRLRAAHATFREDLRQLTASLPSDRRDALARDTG